MDAATRELVSVRAAGRCEYCHLPQDVDLLPFQIDHIVSIKHGGTTNADNLAFSCIICNRNKGSDLGTFLDNTNELIRFFHPRKDEWSEHFSFGKDGVISPLTTIGAATLKILQFNHPDSIIERKLLIAVGQYS